MIEELLKDLKAEKHKDRLAQLWDQHANTRTLGRILTICAVVFAAGISGSWLNAQFEGNLQGLAWGWFGALIAGGAVFLGVLYSTQGERVKGGAIVLVGAAADMLMSYQYFAHAKHDALTALVLGLFPSLLAILCGVAEATAIKVERKQQQEDVTLAFTLEQDALDRQAERERKLIAEENKGRLDIARTEARTASRLKELEIERAGHSNGHEAGNGHATGYGSGPMTGQRPGGGLMSGLLSGEPTQEAVWRWLDGLRSEGITPTGTAVAAQWGCTDRTGRRWIKEWKEARGIRDDEGL